MVGFLARLAMAIHVGLYRLTGGRIGGRIFGMEAMLLTTRGRRSGQTRATPLTFFREGEAMILIASNGGAPRNPAWYHNLMANAETTVRIMDREVPVRAEEIPPAEAEALWPRLLAQAPIYGGYREKTSRTIPLIRLTPR